MVKRVLQASDLALVITEWSFSGTGSDGNAVKMTGGHTQSRLLSFYIDRMITHLAMIMIM